MPAPKRPNTLPATKAAQETYLRRAVDDPAKLARAARIVRAAIERQRLTVEELLPAKRGAAA